MSSEYLEPATRRRALGQSQGVIVTEVPMVLFVCTHNAGRSVAARVLLDHYAQGRVEVRSAGSAPGEQINPAVIEILTERGLEASKEFPKPLTDEVAGSADVLVTMGCGDACPVYPGKRYLDWELEDPAGQSVDAVRPIVNEIDRRVQALLAELVPPPPPDATRVDPTMEKTDVTTEAVRRRYADLATGAADGASCCTEEEQDSFGASQYDQAQVGQLPELAALASLGCGNPTAVVDLPPARWCSTSAPAAGSTSSSPLAGSAQPARPTDWT